MICPVCDKKFSYLKISHKPGQPSGVFYCPNCDGCLKLVFGTATGFGKDEIVKIVGSFCGLAVIYVAYKYTNYPLLQVALGPVILALLVFILVLYFEKFAKVVKVD